MRHAATVAVVGVIVATSVVVVPVVVSFADPQPYDEVVQEDEPTGYWRLNDSIGTGLLANDGSVSGHLGVATGYHVDLEEPGALLNGGDDELTAVSFDPSGSGNEEIPINGATQDLGGSTPGTTAELWFKTAGDFASQTSGSYAILLERSGCGGCGVALEMLGSGQLEATADTYESSIGGHLPTVLRTSRGYDDGGWHQMVVTVDSGVFKLWVDGWVAAKAPVGSHIFFGNDGGTQFDRTTIGGFADGGTTDLRHFDGSIDEVAIYDHGLAMARVQAHYTASGRALPPEPIPDAQTFGSPCSGSEQAVNPSRECADPVNTATGSYTQSVTDLALPMPAGIGAGQSFAWARTYNSADPRVGPLGRGWTFSYGVTLWEDADTGDVTVRFGNGQQLLFRLQGDDSYVAARGGLSTLEKVSSTPDAFDVTLHDKTVLRVTDGRLTKITDVHMFETTLSYHSTTHLLESITDTASRTVSVAWTGDRISEVELPDGRDVVYGYQSGLLHTVQDARGHTTTYNYDDGLLSEVWDPRSHLVTTNEYDSNVLHAEFGRVIHQTDGADNVTDFAWDANAQTATVTDPRGHDGGEDPQDHQWTDVYDANLLISHADPYDNTYQYGYDDDANRTSIITPRDKTWTMVYENGNLVERDWPAPLSFDEHWGYNDDNQVDSYTNANGHTTVYHYNSRRQIDLVDQPDDPVTDNERRTTFGYDPTIHVLTSVTDPLTHQTTVGYDFSAWPTTTKITTTTEEGHGTAHARATTAIYDRSYRLVGVVEPRGNVSPHTPEDYTTHFGYNANDQLTSIIDPLDHETVFGYDNAGNLDERTSARGYTTGYGYDDANRLVSVTPPDLDPTGYEYDSDSNVQIVTDALDRTTTYVYDNANRLDTVDGPLGTTDYHADADANIDQVTPPSSSTIVYGYDAADRLNAINYGDATADVGFVTDGVGHRTEMSDGAGTVTYDYSEVEQLTGVVRGSDEFGYEYDPVGNLTRRVYPDDTETVYTYDDDNNLVTATVGANTVTYGVDEARNVTSVDYPAGNGISETRHYDRAGRLDDLVYTPIDGLASSPVTIELAYTLDQDGNPTSAVTGGTPQSWQYDHTDRLTRWCPGAASCDTTTDDVIWTYDDVGNRLTQHTPSSDLTYNHDPDNDELSFTGITTTYDTRGNLTRMGDYHFTWNLANQLTSAQTPTGSGSTTYDYTYDGDGNRLTAAVSGNTAASREYRWDTQQPVPQLAQEANGTGSPLRRYLYANGRYSMQAGGNTYYTHQAVNATEWLVTDADGHTKRIRSFDPFGATTLDAPIGTGAPEDPHGFDGEYQDPTSTYNLRARHYAPGIVSQFTSRDPLDPIAGTPSTSPYGFANQNPITNVDPLGTSSCGQVSLGGLVDCASGVSPRDVARGALDVAAVPPYAIYYSNYTFASTIQSGADHFGTPGRIVGHAVTLPFVPGQTYGLLGDVAIDAVKGATVADESICDEGRVGYINPFHSFLPAPMKGPQVYLPGVHPGGSVDFAW